MKIAESSLIIDYRRNEASKLVFSPRLYIIIYFPSTLFIYLGVCRQRICIIDSHNQIPQKVHPVFSNKPVVVVKYLIKDLKTCKLNIT